MVRGRPGDMAAKVAGPVVGPVSQWRLLLALPCVGWPLFGGFLLLAVVLSLMPIGYAVAAGLMVGALPDAIGDGFDSSSGRDLAVALVLLGVVLLVQQLLGLVPIVGVVQARFEERVRARLMTAASGPAGVSHLEDGQVVRQFGLAQGGPMGQTAGSSVGMLFGNLRSSVAIVFATTLIGLFFEWWIAIGWAIICLFARSLVVRSMVRFFATGVEVGRAWVRTDYLGSLGLEPAAAKELRLFGLRDWIIDRYASAYADFYGPYTRVRADVIRQVLIMVPLGGAALAGLLVLLGREAASGDVEIGVLAMVAQGALTVWQSSSFATASQVLGYFGLAALPATAEVERASAAVAAGEGGGRTAGELPYEAVRFEDVRFSYPTGSHEVLRGLSLEIRTGESLAIVGLNGAGKTTLVKLLAGLYQPSGGRITVDGIELTELDGRSWQRRLAVVFQDFIHYELSAAENVALGVRDDPGGELAMEWSAREAGLDDVVDALPLQWRTPMSRRYADGADLSGGQWQRVALARALYALRQGAEVLVLDEPTANLDVRAEAELFSRFLEITRGRTTVLISHRFSTVRQAQRICVIEDGRVVEEGSHDALLASGGRYATMFNLQAARFVDEDGRHAELSGDRDA